MQYVEEQGKTENLLNDKPFWLGSHHLVLTYDDIGRFINTGFMTNNNMALSISREGIDWCRSQGFDAILNSINGKWWLEYYKREHAMLVKLTWA